MGGVLEVGGHGALLEFCLLNDLRVSVVLNMYVFFLKTEQNGGMKTIYSYKGIVMILK